MVGGDGTHRGAEVLAKALLAKKLKVSVVGIPKTIDNDIDLIDRVCERKDTSPVILLLILFEVIWIQHSGGGGEESNS